MTWEPSRDDRARGEWRPLPAGLPGEAELRLGWVMLQLGCAMGELSATLGTAALGLEAFAAALETLRDDDPEGL